MKYYSILLLIFFTNVLREMFLKLIKKLTFENIETVENIEISVENSNVFKINKKL